MSERSQPAGLLTIDLGALAANWRALAKRIAPAECAGVVKANAYGIGLEQAVGALFSAGCRTFFVARIEEGVCARKALGAAPARIFVLDGLQAGADPADYLAHGLAPVLGSPEELALWAPLAANAGAQPCAIHVDTGMSRLGFTPSELEAALARHVSSRLAVDLVMSHFIASEAPHDPFNARQIAAFDKARALVPGARASLANSSGVFLGRPAVFDLVRAGYALYGGNPTPGAPNPMARVVTLEATIQRTRTIEPGQSVGYNGQWIARRTTRLATLLIGYADGLPRTAGASQAGGGAEVVIAGRRCPLVGRVSMDLCVADVTDAPPVRPGERAQILGDKIGVDELGARCGTIGYHILTSLGARFSRRYVDAPD